MRADLFLLQQPISEECLQERGTSARSRNVRLAALHSFFQYEALQVPNHSGLIEQVLAIPSMRYARNPIEFLTHVEIEALLAATDQDTWLGRRDRTLLLLALQTGLRVSELIGLRWQAIVLGTGAHVRCQGKGRKTRCTPLRKDTVAALKAWQQEQQGRLEASVFPNAWGQPLSRDGVAYLLAKYVAMACQHCPSLQHKRVTPHVYATPPPWNSCKMVSTAQSSPYGWVMNQWTRLRSTCMPVLNSKSERLRKRHP